MPAKAPFFEPMLCEIAERPPEGPEWRYELTLDGYRAIGLKTDGRTQLWSHNEKDFVGRFPGVAKALAYLPEQRRPTVRLSPRRARQTFIRPAAKLWHRCGPGGALGV